MFGVKSEEGQSKPEWIQSGMKDFERIEEQRYMDLVDGK